MTTINKQYDYSTNANLVKEVSQGNMNIEIYHWADRDKYQFVIMTDMGDHVDDSEVQYDNAETALCAALKSLT